MFDRAIGYAILTEMHIDERNVNHPQDRSAGVRAMVQAVHASVDAHKVKNDPACRLLAGLIEEVLKGGEQALADFDHHN